MPAFSQAAATLGPVVSPILNMIIPGAGTAINNVIKSLPDLYVRDKFFMQSTFNPLYTLSGTTMFAADMPLSTTLEGGIISAPPGKPLFNSKFVFDLPNIAKFVDGIFQGGTVIALDPLNVVGTLLNVLQAADNAPALLNQIQCYIQLGIGAPGPLGDILGAPQCLSISGGIAKHVTPFIGFDFIQQCGLINGYFAACLQPPSINIAKGILSLDPTTIIEPSQVAPALTGNFHVFGTGFRSKARMTKKQTSINLNLDVLHDTKLMPNAAIANTQFELKGPGMPTSFGSFSAKFKFALFEALGGIFPLKVQLGTNKGSVTIFGLQIFKYPGILGSALKQAILNLVG